jgi:hypothetical protein
MKNIIFLYQSIQILDRIISSITGCALIVELFTNLGATQSETSRAEFYLSDYTIFLNIVRKLNSTVQIRVSFSPSMEIL